LNPPPTAACRFSARGVGTHHVVGRAMNAAANAGDIIEMAPSYFLRVI
jgi:hypothetical protein